MLELTLNKLKTEIDKHPVNHGNVLAGCVPVFANWAINPGTQEDITNETSAAALSTAGGGAVDDCTIIYDLGTNKRRIIYVNCEETSRIYLAGEDQVYHDTMDIYSTELQYSSTAVGLFRYVKFLLVGAVTMSYLKLRVYDLEADP